MQIRDAFAEHCFVYHVPKRLVCSACVCPWTKSLGKSFKIYMSSCAGIMAAILCELLASISGTEQNQCCKQEELTNLRNSPMRSWIKMYVLFCRDPTNERGAEGDSKFSKSFFPRPCILKVFLLRRNNLKVNLQEQFLMILKNQKNIPKIRYKASLM